MRITEKQLRKLIHESIREVILEMSPRKMKELKEFIRQARAIHGDKYDYSKVTYNGTDNFVTIICPKHGEFPQRPHHHLQGQGCPRCLDSHLERETSKALESLGIGFIYEHPLGNQSLDFYLPQFNAAIECQGRQHYEPVWGFQRLEQQKVWDARKKTNCLNQGIRLFEILYTDIKIVPQKVAEIVNQLKQSGNQTGNQ